VKPRILHRHVVVLLALAAVVAGCSADATPPQGLIGIPTQSPGPILNLGPQECPLALLEGTLVRHDGAGFAVQGDPLFEPQIVVWPHGWFARDAGDVRELLDAGGHVVAREGDRFSAGGGFYPPDNGFRPCGGITFTPGS
jgi:hypothetical protein